jgi:hypothetical protein
MQQGQIALKSCSKVNRHDRTGCYATCYHHNHHDISINITVEALCTSSYKHQNCALYLLA